jgi:hypothetical protein
LDGELVRVGDAFSFLADADAKVLVHNLNRVSDTIFLEDLVDPRGEVLVKVLGDLNIDVGVGTGPMGPDIQVIAIDETIEPSGGVTGRDTEDLDTIVACRVVTNRHGDGGQHHGEESEDAREQHFAEDWVRCRSRKGTGTTKELVKAT